MSSNIPDAISNSHADHTPNQEILLSTERVVCEINDVPFEADGEMVMPMLPSPRIGLRFSPAEQEQLWSLIADNIRKTFRVGSGYQDVTWTLAGVNGGVVTLMPKPQVLTTRESADLSYVLFHVLNFPDFHADAIKFSNGAWKTGRLRLEAADWLIHIDATQSTMASVHALNSSGGYAITHVGRLERADGSTFSSEEAQRLLDDLRYLLSFARGLWVTPLIVTGHDRHGLELWRDWRIRSTHSWKTVPSWFDPMYASNTLPPTFPGYMKRLKEPIWGSSIKQVAYWYVLSNSLANVDGALVLTQAALELLAWNLLVVDQRCLDENAFERMDATNQIRLLLNSCGIPLTLPASCTELSSIAKAYNLSDGPSALTFVRNKTVHPSKKKISLRDAYPEAWNLALAYVELVLLRLFGYQGRYRNRYDGREDDVPWIAP